MQDSRDRSTPPHETPPRAPRPGRTPGDDSARLRFAALGAGLAVLASALITGEAIATAVGVALALAGVVMGIITLVRSRGSSARGLLIALGVVAVLWGALNAVSGGSRLVVWPATQAYQECTEQALTLSSQQTCRQQLNDNVWNHFAGRPLETGAPATSPSPEGSAAATASPAASPSATASTPPSPGASGSASPSTTEATPTADATTPAP
ncbi:DUF308 domain-containing protein [Kocuria sp.]|uniref:DUF308 domain-containing protein n=1 Tax=Kocuria sp. TaxID=1871328 RepID=UPI0026DB4A57|nr:DUF308 domain-containing protein [Kocuria sp.]MDO4919321.1 DUF308 domain-containing protein [Kocuria sp.]